MPMGVNIVYAHGDNVYAHGCRRQIQSWLPVKPFFGMISISPSSISDVWIFCIRVNKCSQCSKKICSPPPPPPPPPPPSPNQFLEKKCYILLHEFLLASIGSCSSTLIGKNWLLEDWRSKFLPLSVEPHCKGRQKSRVVSSESLPIIFKLLLEEFWQ